MSCEDNTCGIGGYTGPEPGDPDNSLSLSARTVYGGIKVYWSYPTVNPHALAYVTVYRSAVNNFAQALEIARTSASFYVDHIDPANSVTYYYWIQVTSIHGTVGDRLGPVSAEARPMAFQTLETLTGLIDAGVLAQTLKTDIAGITLNNQAIYQEIQDRLNANAAFAAAYADVQAGLEQTMALITEEVTQRQDGDNALVQSVEIVAAANADALAAVDTERTARVAADSAMAEEIDSLIAKVGDNTAGLIHDVQVNTDTISSLASDVTTLASTVGDSDAGLVHDMQVLSTDVSSLASDVTTVEAAINGDVATGQVGLTTQVETLDGKVTEIGSLYTVKLQVNGLIGGFGVYNNGVFVEAGFDVDMFWVGRTNEEKVKPFVIYNGVVYLDKARIGEAWIGTLHIAQNAVSTSAYMGGDGGIVVDGGTSTMYSNMTVNFAAQASVAIIVDWTAIDQQPPGDTLVITSPWMRVYVNGTQVMYSAAPQGGHRVQMTRITANGNANIQIEFGDASADGQWQLGSWGVLVMGLMR